MSRSFLTGINLNKNELLNARIQNLATAPSSPVAGQIYYNTEDNTLRYYNGTSWLTLAQGGDLAGAISAAIDALTTDDIEQGSSNLYYTTGRAKDDAADLLTSATKTNITITGDGSGLTITAENGVADSTTDDLTEGTTNLYFTEERAQDAVGNAVGTGLSYDDTSGTVYVSDNTYDAYGAAAAAETAANGYTDTAIGALTTNDIEEGLALYFTDERAQDAVGNSVGTGLSYNDTTGAISVDTDTVATKTYVDGLVQGLNVKDSVRTASTEDIDLTADAPSTIGGVSIANGDRVLLKNQSPASENGIYVYNSSTKRLTRAEDQDAPEKGDYALVVEGTYAATGWLVTSAPNGPIVEVAWTQFSAANEYTAGNGIAIASNVISADLDGDQSGLSLGSGGLSVNLQNLGGLAKSILDGSIFVSVAGGITKDELTGAVKLDTANGYGIKKYSVSCPELTPTDGVVTWTVTHNIGNNDVIIQVFDKTSAANVEVDVVHTSTTVATLSWVAAATVAAADYRVVVIG